MINSGLSATRETTVLTRANTAGQLIFNLAPETLFSGLIALLPANYVFAVGLTRGQRNTRAAARY